jgi:hypothetical protein
MDSGNGYMNTFKNRTELEEFREALLEKGLTSGSVFEVGEVVEIKTSRFKVIRFGRKFMKLRILPKEVAE